MAGSVTATGVAWIDGVQVSARELRFLTTAHLVNGATALDVRSGLRPGVNAGQVTVPVTGMQVQVSPGVGFIEASDGGAYMLFWDSNITLDVPAAEAQARRDIVVARVVDNGDTTSTYTLEVVQGVAGSGAAPAVPTNALFLKEIAVGANVTSITNANLSGSPVWTTGVGVLSCKDSTEYPAHALQGGALIFDRALDVGLLSVGGVWREVFRPANPATATNGRAQFDINTGEIIVNTTTTDAAATWLDKTGAPSVQLRVGASGVAKVTICAELYNEGAVGTSARMGFKGSGANTITATLSRCVANLNERQIVSERTIYLNGLNPGLTTFTCQFYASSNKAHFEDMSILAEAL